MPNRSWSRRSGPGAHQLASPSSRISDGTSSARTMVASIRTPRAMPTAICFMKKTGLTAKAANTTAIIKAAALMIRPVRATPARRPPRCDRPESRSSLMRAITSTA